MLRFGAIPVTMRRNANPRGVPGPAPGCAHQLTWSTRRRTSTGHEHTAATHLRRRNMASKLNSLQGLTDEFDFGPQRDALTYKQLGNGVNTGVVWNVLKAHVARDAHLSRPPIVEG